MSILLPQTNKDGKPYISYSQYKSWKEVSSFNLRTDGWKEYMAKYFLGYKFPDKGWAEFGNDVEDYICLREQADKFTDKEKEVLDTIVPLGNFQDSIEIDMGEYSILVKMDDRTDDWSLIRDYKTASKNSAKQYEKPEYKQLDIYALAAISITGKIPELEVLVIERKGNCMFSGGREVLTVGDSHWTIPIETTFESLEQLKNDISETVIDISNHYKQFIELNK